MCIRDRNEWIKQQADSASYRLWADNGAFLPIYSVSFDLNGGLGDNQSVTQMCIRDSNRPSRAASSHFFFILASYLSLEVTNSIARPCEQQVMKEPRLNVFLPYYIAKPSTRFFRWKA